MSKCISSAGEFGSHELDESGPNRFVCRLCWALDEEQILATVTDAEARLARVEALADLYEAAGQTHTPRSTWATLAAELRHALAPVEPATEEADRG